MRSDGISHLWQAGPRTSGSATPTPTTEATTGAQNVQPSTTPPMGEHRDARQLKGCAEGDAHKGEESGKCITESIPIVSVDIRKASPPRDADRMGMAASRSAAGGGCTWKTARGAAVEVPPDRLAAARAFLERSPCSPTPACVRSAAPAVPVLQTGTLQAGTGGDEPQKIGEELREAGRPHLESDQLGPDISLPGKQSAINGSDGAEGSTDGKILPRRFQGPRRRFTSPPPKAGKVRPVQL